MNDFEAILREVDIHPVSLFSDGGIYGIAATQVKRATGKRCELDPASLGIVAALVSSENVHDFVIDEGDGHFSNFAFMPDESTGETRLVTSKSKQFSGLVDFTASKSRSNMVVKAVGIRNVTVRAEMTRHGISVEAFDDDAEEHLRDLRLAHIIAHLCGCSDIISLDDAGMTSLTIAAELIASMSTPLSERPKQSND